MTATATQTKTMKVQLTSKVAKVAKPAAKKPAAKVAKPATTPKTLICKCCGQRFSIDEFTVDHKYDKTNFGRNTWHKGCVKEYRANKKAQKLSTANDVQPIAAPRGRRSSAVPTPPAAEAPVAEAISNVNATLDACAA